MSKIQYQNFQFKESTLKLIAVASRIVNEYQKQGFVLTVRQLYYQLVARDYIPNNERSYKRVTGTINDARLAGLIDWDAIEDRTRSFHTRSRWESASRIVEACARQFHMDMWANQPHRVFCIVEKEALVNVFQNVCHEFDVPLLAARGYPSASVLQEFGELLYHKHSDQEIVVLHFGDHDPSGIDMTRDLTDRVSMFARSVDGIDLRRIALNMDQIEELGPPPNPAKTTDARFASYRSRFGNESWELDALNPQYLSRLVRENVDPLIDQDAWEERRQEIEHQRSLLEDAAARMDDES